MGIDEASVNLAAAVDLAQTEAVHLELEGNVVAVLISPERYDVLMTALEDAEDVSAVAAAEAEGGPAIPVEQVRRELGLT